MNKMAWAARQDRQAAHVALCSSLRIIDAKISKASALYIIEEQRHAVCKVGIAICEKVGGYFRRLLLMSLK